MKETGIWKKGDSTSLCKSWFLVQVGRDKQDKKLIPFLYTAKIVNTEKLKWMGEKVKKPEVIQGCNKFLWGMNSADQMFHYCHEIDQLPCVISATYTCPEQGMYCSENTW